MDSVLKDAATSNQQATNLLHTEIPTDGFDPQLEISAQVRRLRDSGRIIGNLTLPSDSKQAERNSEQDDQRPATPSNTIRQVNLEQWTSHQESFPVDQTIAELEAILSPTSQQHPQSEHLGHMVEIPTLHWPQITSKLINESGCSIGQLGCVALDQLTDSENRLVVTSTCRGDGCSTVAISIARWAEMQGKSVLLVDGDLSRPEIATTTGIPRTVSWLHALIPTRSPYQSLAYTPQSSLYVMPMGRLISRVNWPSNMLNQLGKIIEEIRGSFDLVVLDVGPFSQVITELDGPQKLGDAFILATAENRGNSNDRQRTQTAMQLYGIEKLMIASNFVSDNSIEPAMVG